MRKYLSSFTVLLMIVLVGCSQVEAQNEDFLVEKPVLLCDPKLGTDSFIVKYACEEVVELQNDSSSDLEKVRALRSWVASWWPYSDFGVSELPSEYWKVDPEELFRFGREARYGGVCGPTAWMLMHVYHKFGLEAWIYNFGRPAGIATHVVTLVKVGGSVILQDAYLNAELSYIQGSAADARKAINLISLGGDKLKFNYKELGIKRCIGSSPDACAMSWISKSERDVTCKLNRKSPTNFLCDVSNFNGRRILLAKEYWENLEDFLSSQKLKPSLESLLLFPINLTGVDGVAIFEASQKGGTSQVLFNEIFSAVEGKF